MKFLKMPNGKVWLLADPQWLTITGVVRIPNFDNLEDLEAINDAIAEAVSGSTVGLSDFGYTARGNDLVTFRGRADACGEDPEEEFEVLVADDPQVKEALKAQYGLSDADVSHALVSIDCDYGTECVLDIQGSTRSIHSPAYPEPCSYVRVVCAGLEIAYWSDNEWQESPSEVMGAILGAANGHSST